MSLILRTLFYFSAALVVFLSGALLGFSLSTPRAVVVAVHVPFGTTHFSIKREP